MSVLVVMTKDSELTKAQFDDCDYVTLFASMYAFRDY